MGDPWVDVAEMSELTDMYEACICMYEAWSYVCMKLGDAILYVSFKETGPKLALELCLLEMLYSNGYENRIAMLLFANDSALDKCYYGGREVGGSLLGLARGTLPG